jgi:hypothetical protein
MPSLSAAIVPPQLDEMAAIEPGQAARCRRDRAVRLLEAPKTRASTSG